MKRARQKPRDEQSLRSRADLGVHVGVPSLSATWHYCFPACGSPGGGGMLMSIFVTGPSESSGLPNSAVLPTTKTLNWSLRIYLVATLATSGCVTLSIPARYLSR